MPDLISHHEPRIIATEGGWTTWAYRDAQVVSSGVHNRLVMPAHPYRGVMMGNVEIWVRIIDRWLDHGDLPRPFVWPIPPKPDQR